VHRDDLRPGILQHLSVLQALVIVIKDTHLGGDGHVAVPVRRVDQLVDELHIVHQKRSVIPFLGNPLRIESNQNGKPPPSSPLSVPKGNRFAFGEQLDQPKRGLRDSQKTSGRLSQGAHTCGQPKFKSTASHCPSTKRAAAAKMSGSLAQNCTMSGRSAGHVVNCPPRHVCRKPAFWAVS